MKKSQLKARPFVHRRTTYRLETGFSMLEAVVVVGVLLALAVGGFFAYGPITENAKNAKVKAAASEIYTGVVVADSDGDSKTQPKDVIDTWNGSTDEILVEILEPTEGAANLNSDFCVQATNVKSPQITARQGSCSNVTSGSGSDIDGDGIPNGSDPDIDGDGIPNGEDTTPNGSDPDSETPPTGGGQPAMMRTTWDTRLEDSACSTITLPLTGTVDVTIDWGDGTIDKVTGTYPSHTYSNEPGIQNIGINGTFTGWTSGAAWSPPTWSAYCITAVTEWGETGTTDLTSGFLWAGRLTYVDRLPSTVTNMSGLFSGTGAATETGTFTLNTNEWDTTGVTDMSYMFAGTKFDQDISGWDTSQVTNMMEMFEMSSFNRNISGWDTSKVTNMAYMFGENYVFDQPIGRWNVQSLTDASFMFYHAESFNQPLDEWRPTSLLTGTGMFYHAKAFNQPLAGWGESLSQVEYFDSMFEGASSFNQDLSGWLTFEDAIADNFRVGSKLSHGNLPQGWQFE